MAKYLCLGTYLTDKIRRRKKKKKYLPRDDDS